MAISTATAKVTKNGNGSATVFSFSPIVIYDADHLEVTLVAADGTETALSRGSTSSTYSVSLTDSSNLPSTGSITYPASGGTPIASGVSLVIKRSVPILQENDLEFFGGYFPNTQEQSLDFLTMQNIDQQDDLDRSIKVAVSDTYTSLELPLKDARKGKVLSFHSTTGDPQASSFGDISVSIDVVESSPVDGHFLVHDGSTWINEAPATARTSLGLGTAAVVDTGVSDGDVPAMDSTGYPAADGSQITALAGGNITAASVPLTALASQAANTFVMNATGSAAVPTAATATQALASLGIETYDSGQQTLPSAGATLQLQHGLTDSDHTQVQAYLECTTTDNGWAVGDKVAIPPISFDSTVEQGYAVSINDTHVEIVRGASASSSMYKKSDGDSFTYTDSSWRVVVYVTRMPS